MYFNSPNSGLTSLFCIKQKPQKATTLDEGELCLCFITGVSVIVRILHPLLTSVAPRTRVPLSRGCTQDHKQMALNWWSLLIDWYYWKSIGIPGGTLTADRVRPTVPLGPLINRVCNVLKHYKLSTGNCSFMEVEKQKPMPMQIQRSFLLHQEQSAMRNYIVNSVPGVWSICNCSKSRFWTR